MKKRYEIVKRDSETCEHNTGVFHSVGLDCDFVESMYRDLHLDEADPQHQEMWHNPKNAIILEV